MAGGPPLKSLRGTFALFHNPPKGDRREVVLFCEIGDLEGFTRPYFDHPTSITDGK